MAPAQLLPDAATLSTSSSTLSGTGKLEAACPGSIVKLEETVINRIAAGEVVVRPANALKELIENCLDAGSKHIAITAKAGGLKMLRIEDDGHGIRLADLPILCERFTTSKLRKYEDLSSISTFGFRGEALASISHVAHVTVNTMTKSDSVAHVAHYTDGILRGPPKPCAGTIGTTIVVEDLFYNNLTRRQALNKESIEYAKILDVVQKYAVHYPKVAFTCRKANGPTACLNSPGGEELGRLDAIATIYGQRLARELFAFEATSTDDFRASCVGFASGPNWTTRSCTLTVFINQRLVECGSLKRAVEAVYAPVLPRNQHPWVFVALEVDPMTIDVNVHPTKSEVQFLNEEAITNMVQEALASKLGNLGGNRVFTPMAPPPAAAASSVGTEESRSRQLQQSQLPLVGGGPSGELSQATFAVEKTKATYLDPTRIRADHRQRSLESMFTQATQVVPMGPSTKAFEVDAAHDRQLVFEEAQQLTSIRDLRLDVRRAADAALSQALHQSVFVGAVNSELVLLQCGKALCLANLARIGRECAYQRLLRLFGGAGSLTIARPLPLRDVLKLGIMDPGSGYDAEAHPEVDPDELADRLVELLNQRADMLNEYFMLEIKDGKIVALPNALGLTSSAGLSFDGLPLFLVRLCAEANWTEEKACFQSICRIVADFCVEAFLPEPDEVGAAASSSKAGGSGMSTEDLNAAVGAGEFEDVAAAAMAAAKKRARTGASPQAFGGLRWLHEAVRRDGACAWPAEFSHDGTYMELVSLDQLYRIFERC